MNAQVVMKNSVAGWGNEDFNNIFIRELIDEAGDMLVSDEVISAGTMLVNSSMDVVVLGKFDTEQSLLVKVGVLYMEALGGYCCGEEEPILSNAYCECNVMIDKETSIADIEAVVGGEGE